MWTTMQLDGGSIISKQYRALENFYSTLAEQYLNDERYADTFNIIINDKPYNVLFSAYYIMMQFKATDLHFRLANRATGKELTRYSEIISRPNCKYSQNTFMSLKKKSEQQYKIGEHIVCALSGLSEHSACYDMVAAVTQVNPGLFGKMLTETSIIAYVAFKVSDDDFFVNDSSIHTLALYYWASKLSGFTKFKNNINNKVFQGHRKNLSVGKNESFEDFVRRNVKTKYSADLVLGMLINNNNYFCAYENYYLNIDNLIKSAKLQLKTSESTNELYQHLLNAYKNGEALLPKYIIELMGTKNASKYALASMTASVNIPKFVSIYNYYAGLLWLYREYYDVENKGIISENRMLKLDDGITTLSYSINNASGFFTSKMISLMLPSMMNKINKSESENVQLREDLKDKNSKLCELKSSLRSSEKARKQLDLKADCMSNEIANLRSKLSIDTSVESLEKQQSTINRLVSENRRHKQVISDQETKMRALHKNLDETKKDLDRSSEKLGKLEGEVQRLEESNKKLASMTSEPDISTQVYLNAINDKRITIIGARKLHSRISSYGLRNLKLYEEECKNIQLGDIINQDIVVIMTSFIDHSSVAKVSKMCKQYDIRLLNYNNANTDSLIRSIFIELYK